MVNFNYKSLLLYVVMVTAVPSAFAFDFSAGKIPVDIEADQGIVCEQDQNKCTAQGQVKVTHGASLLQADQLIAYFAKAANPAEKSEQKLVRLEAKGQVILSSTEKKQKAYAAQAVYDIDKGMAVLTGGQLRLEVEDLTITAQESLQYLEKMQEAVAVGRAKVVRGEHTIEADELRAFMHKDKNGQLVIQRVTAHGNVVITGPKEVVQGGQGEYIHTTQIVAIEDDVRISHKGPKDQTQLSGQYAEVNLTTGQSRLLAAKPGTVARSKVKILLMPQRS